MECHPWLSTEAKFAQWRRNEAGSGAREELDAMEWFRWKRTHHMLTMRRLKIYGHVIYKVTYTLYNFLFTENMQGIHYFEIKIIQHGWWHCFDHVMALLVMALHVSHWVFNAAFNVSSRDMAGSGWIWSVRLRIDPILSLIRQDCANFVWSGFLLNQGWGWCDKRSIIQK